MQKIKTLSGGQKCRVGIYTYVKLSLANNLDTVLSALSWKAPHILLLDEVGISPEARFTHLLL